MGLKNLLELVEGDERNSVLNLSLLSSISMWPDQGTRVCCARITTAKLSLTNLDFSFLNSLEIVILTNMGVSFLNSLEIVITNEIV